MFNIDDKDYWVIVALSENGDAFILKQSADLAAADDLIIEGMGSAAYDNGIKMEWAKDQPLGIYRLVLRPNKTGDDIDDIDVTAVTMLFEAP